MRKNMMKLLKLFIIDKVWRVEPQRKECENLTTSFWIAHSPAKECENFMNDYLAVTIGMGEKNTLISLTQFIYPLVQREFNHTIQTYVYDRDAQEESRRCDR